MATRFASGIYTGVIERFIQVGTGARHSRYQATLVPTIKPLAFTRNLGGFSKTERPRRYAEGTDRRQNPQRLGQQPAAWQLWSS